MFAMKKIKRAHPHPARTRFAAGALFWPTMLSSSTESGVQQRQPCLALATRAHHK